VKKLWLTARSAEEPSKAALLALLDDEDADGVDDGDATRTLATKTSGRGSWGARAWEADTDVSVCSSQFECIYIIVISRSDNLKRVGTRR
jgi:hypothetical protein